MLNIDAIHVSIGSVQVLRGLTLSVPEGRMVGLVGRNGAGKTTLIRSVMGHLSAAQGRIGFEGQNLAALPRHARAHLGIGYMPEDRGLVPELTVEENILVPVWMNKALDEAGRLALVYQVLPELREIAAVRYEAGEAAALPRLGDLVSDRREHPGHGRLHRAADVRERVRHGQRPSR